MSNPSNLFSKQQKDQIVQAIKKAETSTSAEIKVHIEKHCTALVLDRATEVFRFLKMNRTKERNGVLIYLAIEDRLTAIIGDENINKHVSPSFWNDCYKEMATYFKAADYTGGIKVAISLLELELKNYFPHQHDDVNELTDEISFSE